MFYESLLAIIRADSVAFLEDMVDQRVGSSFGIPLATSLASVFVSVRIISQLLSSIKMAKDHSWQVSVTPLCR
jgi:hypothetical protein